MIKLSSFIFTTIFLLSPLLHAEFHISDFKNRWSGDFLKTEDESDSYYKIITSPELKPSFIELKSDEAIPLEGRFVRIQFRVSDLENLSGLELRMSPDDSYENRFAISVPLFTDKDFNIVQSGEWVNYTFTIGNGDIVGSPSLKNIKNIGIYVESKNNSNQLLTVDLKDFKIEQSALPAAISMTFDDGYDFHFDIAQLMQKYGLRGTAYVMTEQIGLSGYLTLEQLNIMYYEYHWGISAHHFTPITEMSLNEMSLEFEKTFKFLTQVTPTYTELDQFHISSPALHFAYPLGKQSRATTLENIKKYFLSARVASGGGETLPPSDWRMLRAYNITNEITPEMFEERLNLAIENNEWLILMFHKFTDEESSDDPLVYPIKQFTRICEIIQSKGISTHPVHEIYEALK